MRNPKRLDERHSGEVSAVAVRPAALERRPIDAAPQLSSASGQLLRELQVIDEYGDHHTIRVPVERPLSIVMDGAQIATLWTLGAAPEWLVLGYLWAQQLVSEVGAVQSITVDWQSGTASVTSRRPNAP